MTRINTNVSAINTLRVLGQSRSEFAKSVGRLSSGFRINRAADDAAGLGIANSLRSDIRATRQASRNAEQANSVLQVMEGSAQQVQGILERMKELAAQAASDSVDADARTQIDSEFEDLSGELDRIVDSTVFQGQALLDGSFGSSTVTELDSDGDTSITNNTGITSSISDQGTFDGLDGTAVTASLTNKSVSTSNVAAGADGDATTNGGLDGTITVNDAAALYDGIQSADGNFSVTNDGTTATLLDADGNTVATTDVSGLAAGADLTFDVDGDSSADITFTGDGANALDSSGEILTFDADMSVDVELSGGGATTEAQTLDAAGADATLTFSNFGVQVDVAAAQNAGGLSLGSNDSVATSENQAEFLVSASRDYTGQDLVGLTASDLQASTLGVDTSSIDLSTASGAQTALTDIDSAIDTVSDTFSDIGAAQNRLDFARSNAESAIENLSAAESVIRDVDMAAEVTRLTKFQILQQAGQAMLAQANSAPQGVLQLLS